MDASFLTTIARAESYRGARGLPTHPWRLELQTLRTDSGEKLHTMSRISLATPVPGMALCTSPERIAHKGEILYFGFGHIGEAWFLYLAWADLSGDLNMRR